MISLLTPFAAEMRYDYLPDELTEDDRLDRDVAMKLIHEALQWAQNVIEIQPE